MAATRTPDESDTVYGCDEDGNLWEGSEHLVLKGHYDCKGQGNNGYNSSFSYSSYDRYFVWKRLPMPDSQDVEVHNTDERRFLIKKGLVPEVGNFFEPYKMTVTDVRQR